MFILGVEPLKEIEESGQIMTSSARKTIAYNNDVTCCIKIKSLETLFDVISDLCDPTSLEKNTDKSVILSIRNLNGYNSEKITGFSFNLADPETDLFALMKELISKIKCTIARCKTMRAKDLAI